MITRIDRIKIILNIASVGAVIGLSIYVHVLFADVMASLATLAAASSTTRIMHEEEIMAWRQAVEKELHDRLDAQAKLSAERRSRLHKEVEAVKAQASATQRAVEKLKADDDPKPTPPIMAPTQPPSPSFLERLFGR